MKKFLLILFTACMASTSILAYNVSTEPQNKKILLEEFTGVKCGNCPDGHAMAKELHLAKPDDVIIVSIHAGYYAIPTADMPNFQTDSGTALNDFFEVNSYPSGMVNRRVFEGSTPIVGRSSWTAEAKTIYSETAPVNLWLDCQYDDFMEEITVTVEGYWTASLEAESARLGVALLQNNIQGYQAGSGVSDEYIHQHVLRDYFTDAFGDEITGCTEGQYFTKTYTYILPEKYENTEVVPEQMEIIAFVAESEYNVLNATSQKLTHSSFDIPLRAEIAEPKIPISKNYGFSFMELLLENRSTHPITEATFDVTLNGKTASQTIATEVPALSFAQIKVDIDKAYIQKDENAWSITLTALNGEAVDGNTISGEFGKPIECNKTLRFAIRTDNYASDNQYRLLDTEGETVYEFGPYAGGSATDYEETVTLELGSTYCIEVSDAWGDGIYSPRGHVKVYDDSDKLVTQNLEIKDFGFRTFITVTSESGIDDIAAGKISIKHTADSIVVVCDENFTVSIFDIAGRCVVKADNCNSISTTEFTPGVYVVVVTTSSESKQIKIIL